MTMTVTSLEKGLIFASNCRLIMMVFFILQLPYRHFFFTILASLSILAIVVSCIFYVGERLYFNFN